MTRFALSLLVILGLMGCGTTRTAATYEVDDAKVAAIERAAAATGVKILWVHRPQKILASGG
jgi:hypothetical protein